jgi:hypothetical protein
MCFVVHKTTSKLKHAMLTILYLIGAKKIPTVDTLERGIYIVLFIWTFR